MPPSDSAAHKADQLISHIKQWPSVAVAFSGGVDSAVVAQAAFLALETNAVAVTAVSPSLAQSERQIAADVARDIGIRHQQINTNEFSNSRYTANPSNRCFYCKQTLYTVMVEHLAEWKVKVILNGTNADDATDHRPGLQAASEANVRSPLADLKYTKSDVRQIAKFWNLSVAEKPASPCLSSRIAYGIEVTPERVQMIDRAEAVIRKLTSIEEFRVRMEADLLARIEVPTSELGGFLQEPLRSQIVDEFKALGFQTVTIDLEGFRSGRMNERLSEVQLQLP